MTRAVVLAAWCTLAACTTDAPTTVSPTSHRAVNEPLLSRADIAISDSLIERLASQTTAEQLRATLSEGLTKKALKYRGIDAVTVEEWIDGLVAAVLAARQQPDDPHVRARLVAAADMYVSALLDMSAQGFGPTGCLPPVR